MNCITYFRVSTDRQGRSGLGLKAQQEAVRRFLGNVEPIATYQEIESGKRDNRPELRKALDHCRRAGAVLVIAKLDRLARSARFLLELIDSEVEIQFADVPQLSGPQGRFMLTSLAAVAELEAGLVSERTTAALRAAKAKGVKLGNPNGAAALRRYEAEHGNVAAMAGKQRAADARAEAWRGIITEMIGRQMSFNAIARELNAKGETTVRGGNWTAKAVSRLVARLDLKAYMQAA